MFDLSFDIKCAVTTAILSVLVYLLIMNILQRVWPTVTFDAKIENTSEWYKSMEMFMLLSVFIAYNVNLRLFSSCKSF